jgi:hypothetical protein
MKSKRRSQTRARMATKLIAAATSLIIFFTIIAAGYLFIAEKPGDEELREVYKSKSGVLRAIVQMVEEDGNAFSDMSLYSAKNSSLSMDRQEQYRSLIKPLGYDIVIRRGLRQIWIVVNKHRFSFSLTSVKGLLYLPKKFRNGYTVASSLDGALPRSPNAIYIVPIDEDWCLALQFI